MSNAATVQAMYAAFGQGDIPTILSHLADDVEWEYTGLSTDVPWLQPRRGCDAVVGFFQALGAVDFQRFAPKALLEGDGLVVAVLDVAFVVKATGKRVDEVDEVHLWRFDASGKVARFSHRADTHAHWLALQP